MDRIKHQLYFRYTYNRYNRDGQILKHNTGTLSGHTVKSVRLTLVKRFRLQGTGGTWTALVNGTHKRSHRCQLTGERHCLTLTPMPTDTL
ncbi:hypothetical protein F4X10_06515 [Candidatus Poribacteria bacterium]|nr:hypothetical protein [Candidatus Poribacteria bacterium]